MTKSTELALLPPPERAAVVLGTAERVKELKALAEKSVDLIEIRDQTSRDQIHAARMVLKNTRVDLEKKAKAARDDATAFSKAVIAEEKKLVGIIQPEESRLDAIQTEWDDRVERERQAKAEADRQRIAGLQEAIAAIRATPPRFVGAPSSKITDAIQSLELTDTAAFAELRADAETARTEAIEALAKIRADAEAREAETKRQAEEAARLKAEREAFEKEQAAAKAKRDEEERQARERIAAQEREAAAARAAEQKRLDEQQAEIRRAQAEIDRQRREQEEREHRARLAAEAEEARKKQEKEALERRQREAAEAQEAALRRAAEEAEARRRREEQEAAERAIAEKRAREAKEYEERVRREDRVRAAAPAMLTALISITDHLERIGDSRKDAPFIEQGRAAIALATGEEIEV
jgi:hypothetical protein